MGIRFYALLAAALPSVWANSGCAAEIQGLDWQCIQRFDSLFHAECTLGATTPASNPDEAAAATNNGDLLPSPNRYVPLALRPESEISAYPVWRIPLYDVPIDRTNAQYLLQSVLCGNARGCSVRYEFGPPEVIRRVANPFIR